MTTPTGADGYTMPVFVIKAKDALAHAAVMGYQELCIEFGLHEQAAQVDLALAEIRRWQLDHPDEVKLPDHRHVSAPQPTCDCDWPPDVEGIPHRGWCVIMTGVHAEPAQADGLFDGMDVMAAAELYARLGRWLGQHSLVPTVQFGAEADHR